MATEMEANSQRLRRRPSLKTVRSSERALKARNHSKATREQKARVRASSSTSCHPRRSTTRWAGPCGPGTTGRTRLPRCAGAPCSNGSPGRSRVAGTPSSTSGPSIDGWAGSPGRGREDWPALFTRRRSEGREVPLDAAFSQDERGRHTQQYVDRASSRKRRRARCIAGCSRRLVNNAG